MLFTATPLTIKVQGYYFYFINDTVEFQCCLTRWLSVKDSDGSFTKETETNDHTTAVQWSFLGRTHELVKEHWNVVSIPVEHTTLTSPAQNEVYDT